MRNIVVVFALATVLCAQTPRQLSKGKLEIEGATLHLGMTKTQVAEKLFGVEISKIDADHWLVGSPGEEKVTGPTLQFTNGLLSYADRYWTTYDNDIADALFGAVSSLNEEGYSHCTVTADTKYVPIMNSKRVWILCGEKTILLVRFSLKGKFFNTVWERLGEMKSID